MRVERKEKEQNESKELKGQEMRSYLQILLSNMTADDTT